MSLSVSPTFPPSPAPSHTHPLFIFLPPSGPCWYCNHPDARWLLSSPSCAHTLTHTQCAILTSLLLLISSDVCLMNTKPRSGCRLGCGRLSCAPLPEGNLRERGGEAGREEGGVGKNGGGGVGRLRFSFPLSLSNDSEVDKTRRSEDVTCYLSLLLAGGENLHLKISRGRKRNLPFVVCGEEASALAWPLSPITSAIQTGLTEVRLPEGLIFNWV